VRAADASRIGNYPKAWVGVPAETQAVRERRVMGLRVFPDRGAAFYGWPASRDW
jgi:hypothetical protein